MRRVLVVAIACLYPATLFAQAKLSDDVRKYVSVDAPMIAITHVRVIDGTGEAPREDQTLVIANGKIQRVGAAASVTVPSGAKVLDKTGYTVIPGLVGMHNHLYYTASRLRENGRPVPPGFFINEIPYTSPRLYLAAGVTTARTTGSLEPYTDLNVKTHIDKGTMPGPKLFLTAPYLEGSPGGETIPQLYQLKSPEDAKRFVAFWADTGFTSFKGYMHLTRAQLKVAVDEVHRRGLKVTAHLCSIGYREAAEIGVDNLEHGFLVDTEFAPMKKPDECPRGREVIESFLKLDPKSAEVQAMFRTLIDKKVAVTSTLPVFESGIGLRPPLQQRVLDAMSAESRMSYLRAKAESAPGGMEEAYLKKGMELELAFARAGGTLLAGPDPTGNGGVLPGFGDQRELELLVEAGFTPVEAIKIATLNGAEFLGVGDHVGSIAEGKHADLVLINGNPAKDINDVEKVETVFKDGIGYDSQKLIDSVRGQVGIR
jgi:imidazolonepropionase-like amidohydrolase